MSDRHIVIFLSHGDPGAFRLAGSCALAAVALGDRVDVFLFNEAIRSVVEGFDDEEHPAHHLYEARRNADSGAKCRLLGCSASLVQAAFPCLALTGISLSWSPCAPPSHLVPPRSLSISERTSPTPPA